MIQISFYDSNTGKYIKQWPNWSGVVPAVGDVVILHYGDNNEEERPNKVRHRVIDGTKPDSVKIYIEELNTEVEDPKREMERISSTYNQALDIEIVDCLADIGLGAMNICRREGIKTLRDLTLLHKNDLLKIRNFGKNKLKSLDDLLTKHGLTWAK